jgi:DnaA-homolog protein
MPTMKQLLLAFTHPPPTFDNFVAARNAELLAALNAFASGELPERVVYVWGESGAGKTHLLKAFCARTGAPLLEAAAAGQEDFRREIFCLDDVARLPESAQAALFNAFNERGFSRMVVAAPCAPKDLALRKDLATRLATGLAYRCLALSDEEKRLALAAHAETRGFTLAPDVCSYLLTHARRDMPSLIASLDALDRYSLETGRPVTLPLLKAAMQPDLKLENR